LIPQNLPSYASNIRLRVRRVAARVVAQEARALAAEVVAAAADKDKELAPQATLPELAERKDKARGKAAAICPSSGRSILTTPSSR
jgi:hypothetical protein